MNAAELASRVDRVVVGVAHWTPTAWSAAAAGRPDVARADVLHDLVQCLADLAADAESVPRRPVPRLDNDLALPDQLRVVTADLLATDPPPATVTAASAAVAHARQALAWDAGGMPA